MSIHSITESPSYSAQLDLEALRKLIQLDDWAQLSELEFSTRYISLSESLNLDYRTKPFEMLKYPDGRFAPYIPARTSFTLAAQHALSTRYLSQRVTREEVTTVMLCTGPDGREVTRSGTVSLRGRSGADRANAFMHSETKASRRAILAYLKLGFLDESEVHDIDGAERYTGDDLANLLDESDPEPVTYGELVNFKMTAREKGWTRAEWLTLLARYGWKHEGQIRRAYLSEVLTALGDADTLTQIRTELGSATS